MKPFYRLGPEAGLVRSNTFEKEDDAVLMGTYRAYARGVPIRVYLHEEKSDDSNGDCILVCNVDGSVEKPQAVGREMVDLGNQSGATNRDQAHILLASYGNMPLTTYYLKGQANESIVSEIEKATGVELGLYDAETIHCYSDDSTKLKVVEQKLAEAGLEIEHYAHATLASTEAEGVAEIVTAARKAHQRARASKLPELSVKSNSRHGGGYRYSGHCELMEGSDKKAPMIHVYADGEKIGEVKSDRDAAKLMSDHAHKSFAKYLRKELA